MLIENKKKETPEYLLEHRKWKRFLESLPADGERREFFVLNRDDLIIIRVRATQINKDNELAGINERYKIGIKVEKGLLSVTKYKHIKAEE